MRIPSWLARLILKLLRWELVGEHPEVEKFVLIAAPHTATRDTLIMLCVASAFGVRMRFLVKEEMFKIPFVRFFMKRWGGIPVNRRERSNVVGTMAEMIRTAEGRFVLAISPEGTRGKTQWKTGFYYIAHGAGVPVVLGFIDFSTRRTGVGPTFWTTGDIEADMEKIKAFYAPMKGKYDSFSGIELKDKDKA